MHIVHINKTVIITSKENFENFEKLFYVDSNIASLWTDCEGCPNTVKCHYAIHEACVCKIHSVKTVQIAF